ncbi:lactate utilization protein [Parendozoicomonas sp. Alg238-R29]|uniref:LutC/YkgG family protein n=1 Tax=Parendozoicomonas sp. Alg238-R29 TaxID=2993446 RepID=UPI00248E5FB8|nr:lactate utilization protein [Parendozoicomonas sp. Alg238-R29]
MSTGIDSRTNILNRLRKGLGKDPSLSLSDDYGQTAHYDWDKNQRTENFITAMAAVKTEIHRTTEELWPELLVKILLEKDINCLLVSSKRETGKRMATQEFIVESGLTLQTVPDNPPGLKDKLFFDIPATLTTCRSAIAETGSLVLWPDEHEPRAMSLVPPVHFVLLKAKDIYNTLADVIRQEGWAIGMPTNALLISGPSKTADIARILAYGAHGPRELIVLLVE